VKELVTLHKGKIFVASTPGKGTKFTIRLPYMATPQEKPSETEAGIQDAGTVTEAHSSNLDDAGNPGSTELENHVDCGRQC
jgi:hypothetical protein